MSHPFSFSLPSGAGLLGKESFCAKKQLLGKLLKNYPDIPNHFRLDSRLKKYRELPIRLVEVHVALYQRKKPPHYA